MKLKTVKVTITFEIVAPEILATHAVNVLERDFAVVVREAYGAHNTIVGNVALTAREVPNEA